MDSESDLSSCEEFEKSAQGAKRKCDKSTWKKETAKRRRNSGLGYVSRGGKDIPGKQFVRVTHCCSLKCHQKINEDNQKDIFKGFWGIGEKQKQDTLLIGLIDKKEIVCHQTSVKTKNRENAYVYNVKVDGKRTGVCKALFMKLIQVSEGRLKTVLRAVTNGNVIVYENRGKHDNRPSKIPIKLWDLVKEHWALLPSKQSHYGKRKSERKYFDDPSLSVLKLYRVFQQYHFEKTGMVLKVKYSTYHRFFRENSPYAFRQPRTDVCDFCRESEQLLKVNPEDSCKTSLAVHLKKVQRYKSIKDEYIANVKGIPEDDTLVLEFDYGQNLPVPKLSVTSQFYKRLLWLYVFNIHCHNDNTSSFYCFLESNAKKNANTVCSFLFHFIQKKLTTMKNVKKITLLSDSCGGQNKNITVVRFCAWVSKVYKVNITHLFPVRGHSYNQCDRNFGLYGTLLKRVETIETIEQYFDVMKSSRSNPFPFEVIRAANLIEDWSEGLAPFFLSKPMSKNSVFRIQKYVKISYSSRNVAASEIYSDILVQPFSIFSKILKCVECKDDLNLKKVSPPGLKIAKKNDILSLLKFLAPQNADLLRLVVNNIPSDENDEVVSDSGEDDAL